MSAGLGLCGIVAAVGTLFLLSVEAAPGRASGSADSSCPKDYTYTGVQNEHPASGIRAYLSTVRPPDVTAGFAAGWVGVGGPGLGPGKTDEWVQAGYVSFATGEAQVYYEVTVPNESPKYHTVVATLSPAARNLVSVLEVAGQPGTWRVWLNNQPVSPLIALPGSHGRFAPQAIGENWNSGTGKCNVYGFGFGNVQVARQPGGGWQNVKAGYVFRSDQFASSKTAAASFVARSTASAAVTSSSTSSRC
jgi:hypothetical protein